MKKLLILALLPILLIPAYAEFSNIPNQIEDNTYEFVGKQYQKNSECEMMVLQHVFSKPYDYQNLVAPYMLFTQDRCDAEKIPTWTQCPVWVNKDLGFCNFITE